MGIQINGQTDTITATDGSFTIQGADVGSVSANPVTIGTGASISSPATNVLTLGTNNSERVRVSAAGSFGIGTNNPTQLLDVYNGNINLYALTSGQSIRVRTNNGTIGELAQIDGDGTLRLYTNETTPILRTQISSYGNTYINPNGGNVGINSTSPARKLDVVDSGASGSVIRSRVTTNNGGYLAYEALNSSGTSVFSVTHNGRINLSENIVFASGQGLDFSATTNSLGTMSSELLSDYEEGTWTPVDGSGAGLTFQTSTDGYYIKIGRLVHCWGRVTYPSTSNTNSNIIVGFPFTNISGNIIYSGTLNITNVGDNGLLPMMEGNNIQFRNRLNQTFTNAQLSGKFFYFEFNMLTSS